MTAYTAAETACPECDGHGILPWVGSGTGDDHIKCEGCDGDGRIKGATTHACNRCVNHRDVIEKYDIVNCPAVGCVEGQVPYEWATIRPGDVVESEGFDPPALTVETVRDDEMIDALGIVFNGSRLQHIGVPVSDLTFLVDESPLTDERRAMIGATP